MADIPRACPGHVGGAQCHRRYRPGHRNRQRPHAHQSRRNTRAHHGRGGFIRAGAKIGKPEAHRIVEEASRKAAAAKRDLHVVLGEDEQVKLHLSVGELAKLFEPMGYQGAAQTFIDRIVGSLPGRVGKR